MHRFIVGSATFSANNLFDPVANGYAKLALYIELTVFCKIDKVG